MNETVQQALVARLTAFGDDELLLGHRNAEWTGHAPILEEDIALANLAQDELGHATLFYGMVEALTDVTPDELAMFRDAPAFRNVQMVELPKGDWAFTMLRQYLFDAYEFILYEALRISAHQPLADAAAKMRNEEIYHLRHSHVWVERLGLGTAESNRRMQAALDELWRYTGQLFRPIPSDTHLIDAGYVPDVAALRTPWEAMVRHHLLACDLQIPDDVPLVTDGRERHTNHIVDVLADLQMVARTDPDAVW